MFPRRTIHYYQWNRVPHREDVNNWMKCGKPRNLELPTTLLINRGENGRKRAEGDYTRKHTVAWTSPPRLGLDGDRLEKVEIRSRHDCGSSSQAIGYLCNKVSGDSLDLDCHPGTDCESSSGHRILEQTTRVCFRPKGLMEAAGRGPSCFCILFIGRIREQQDGPVCEQWSSPR